MVACLLGIYIIHYVWRGRRKYSFKLVWAWDIYSQPETHSSAANRSRPQCLLWPSIRLRGPGIKQDVRVTTSVIHTDSHSCPNTSEGTGDSSADTHTQTGDLMQEKWKIKMTTLMQRGAAKKERKSQEWLVNKDFPSHLSVFSHTHATSSLSLFFQPPPLRVESSDKPPQC